MQEKEILKEMRKMAKDCLIIVKGEGHFQIRGRLLVNYYPTSKRRTAYIAGTRSGKENVSLGQAIAMANQIPQFQRATKKRKPNTKRIRKSLLVKKNKCVWCGKILTLETSTLEHVIPRARGGLDNRNNYALACAKCNHERGNKC